MEKKFEELYKQYLSGQISQMDFELLKNMVPLTSDEELWDLMCDDLSTSSESVKMSSESQQRILQNIYANVKEEKRQTRVRRFLRYAVMFVLMLSLVGGSYWWINSLAPSAPVYTYVSVKAGSKRTITLPDGTRVTLNGNSQLCYNVVPQKHREVVLTKGEAFFDVTKDASCPFRVKVNDMQIEVLGTEFNVRYHEDAIETALFSGAVRLTSEALKEDYRLYPGKKSIYKLASHQFKICDNDATTDARWKEGYLAFNSKPLAEVLHEIEDWYGVRIQLRNKKLANDLLTGTFYNESLESVLSSLKMQYKFNYHTDNGTIIIE